MKTLRRENANVYAFDRAIKPRLRVQLGETFILETQDTAGGQLSSAEQLPSQRSGLDVFPPRVNPVAGPVYVEGVEKGDTLRVSIHRWEGSHLQRITFTSHRGPLKDSRRWANGDGPGIPVLH